MEKRSFFKKYMTSIFFMILPLQAVNSAEISEEVKQFVYEILKEKGATPSNLVLSIDSEEDDIISDSGTIIFSQKRHDQCLCLLKQRKKAMAALRSAQSDEEKNQAIVQIDQVNEQLNEMIFIISHEYVHIKNGHSRNGTVLLATLFGTAALIATKVGNMIHSSRDNEMTSLCKYGLVGAAAYGASAQMYNCYSRACEKEADLKASCDPAIMRAGAKSLGRYTKKGFCWNRILEFIQGKSHPYLHERVEYLHEKANELESKMKPIAV